MCSFCLLVVVHVVDHEFAEDLAPADVLQPHVGIYGGLNASVTENLSDQLVFARALHQNDCPGRVAKLMSGDAQPDFLPDAFGDLAAQAYFSLRAAALSRK